MLRTLTIGFLVALVVLSAAPGAVGYAAAARQQFLMDRLSGTVPGTALIAETVETGWLTSRMRHRVVVTDQRLLALTAHLSAPPPAAETSIIFIDTRIAHGPWPLLEGRPGLARMRSTLSIGDAGGPLFEIPGEAITDIDFLGGGRTRLAIPGVARRLPGARGTYRFHDLDASLRYNRDLTRMQSRLAVRRIELTGPRGTIATGTVLLEGDTRRLQRGLWVGDTHVSVDQVLLTDPPGIDIEASGVDLDITVHADDGLLEQATRLRVDTLTMPGVATRNIHLETLASDLDAASIAALVDEVIADGHLDLPAERLRELIQAGPALELRDLSLVHAAGDMRLTMRLAIAADRAGEVSSAADLLTIAEGRGQLTVDERLVTHMTGQGRSDAGSEGSQALVALGLLRPDNGRLVADLRLGGGLVTVNGLPLPLRY